jgi:hypothetical protein
MEGASIRLQGCPRKGLAALPKCEKDGGMLEVTKSASSWLIVTI